LPVHGDRAVKRDVLVINTSNSFDFWQSIKRRDRITFFIKNIKIKIKKK
jgi:hypothetical protein